MKARRIVAVLLPATGLTISAMPASSLAPDDPPDPTSSVVVEEGAGAPNDADSPVEVTLDDPTVQSLASELRIPPEEAADILAVQQEAGVVEDRLVAEFSDTYSGRWWSAEERRAKFGMTADLRVHHRIVRAV